jgi:hypothetical protein
MSEVYLDPATHTYTDPSGAVVLSVTQILAKAGICDYSCVPQESRNRGMKRGTSVHWMLQLEDQGAINYRTVPKAMRGYRKAYCEWKRASGFNPLMVEHSFIYGDYAGTVDRAGSFPATTMYTSGTNAIVDIKTGTAAPDWTRYQLAAYAVGIIGDQKLARFTRRIALLLTADGKYKVTEFPLCTFDIDWSKFCYAKEKADASGSKH